MSDTDCRKCKSPMPAQVPIAIASGPFRGASFKVTAYRCPHCNHWNDLKRRKSRNLGSGISKGEGEKERG